jgi:glycine betaine/proline transport system substrate-binding protein
MKRIQTEVVPRYHLKASLVEATTPAMLAELEQAYSMKEPFVFLAWSPHRMNQEYEFRYLVAINEAEDPEVGVRRWLEEQENMELVRPWIEAAKNAQEE